MDEEYEALSKEKQALYDMLDEESYTEKWSHEEFMTFIDELSDNGIETVSDYEDAFYGYNDESRSRSFRSRRAVSRSVQRSWAWRCWSGCGSSAS